MRISRLSLIKVLNDHLVSYPTPLNINYFWGFGSLSGICLIIQIISGIVLSFHYVPEITMAFNSVEHIMRDVNYGWLFRYIHSNGASIFFFVLYIHIARGLYFQSYEKKYLWYSGILIFLLVMATAFLGYVLPWGQMSFWGATVITNLFTAIPYLGDSIATWLWGGFSIGNATLNRFFSLHFFLPFIVAGLSILHLALLHIEGSSSPLQIKYNIDYVNFYPYYVWKDLFGFFLLMVIFVYFVCFSPNYLGHPDNYIPANSLVTPTHIVPEWYFLPFYAILRSVPNKLVGVLLMVSAIVVLFICPFHVVKLSRFNLFFKYCFWLLIMDFILLGWLGAKVVEEPFISLSLIATAVYFLYFLVLLPYNTYITNENQQYTKYSMYSYNIIPFLVFFEITEPAFESLKSDIADISALSGIAFFLGLLGFCIYGKKSILLFLVFLELMYLSAILLLTSCYLDGTDTAIIMIIIVIVITTIESVFIVTLLAVSTYEDMCSNITVSSDIKKDA